MYRFLISVSLASALLFISSCSGNKAGNPANDGVRSKQAQTEVILNENLQKKVGSWMEKGVDCYGIIVGTPKEAEKFVGKSVKSKVISIKPDKIMLKALESVTLTKSLGCDRLGLSYGDTWWEEEGDIFKTREEADAYLVDRGWFAE